MKKLVSMLLMLSLLASCSAAMAAATGHVIASDIATRSGPSTKYTEPGTFLSYGSQVIAHTKVWDSRNEIWWVQVEFTSGSRHYRAYTGDWRLSIDLNYVPTESVLFYSSVGSRCYGYAGPGYDYYQYKNIVAYQYSSCTVYEVENNFALVEIQNSSQGLTRFWLPLDDIVNGYRYYGQNTYPDYDQGYTDGWYDDDGWGGATLLPDDDWYNGIDSGYTFQEPIGQYVTIWVEEGNARSGPGTNYSFLNYVRQGQVYEVLDWEMGNTGKDWYQVRVNGRLCWISSGLVTLNGNSNGTAYGVPIEVEDPLADYPQSSTHLVGRWMRVTSSSAHVREKPDTGTQTVAYVTSGQYYEILDCRIGNTGRVWYKITVEGETGWISSGVCTVV